MMLLDPIPLDLDTAVVKARLRVDATRPGSWSIDELAGLARDLMRPRAVCQVAAVGAKGEGTVEVAGVIFHSSILRKNLDAAHCVFPYIITVGPELERAATAQGDLLKQYGLEEIANIALEHAALWLSALLEERFALRGLANMSPGSLEDWPITEQRELFSIFGDTEGLLGVRLTESMLMVPRKSVSGIFFPSDEGFIVCQLCERQLCPARKAAVDPQQIRPGQECSQGAGTPIRKRRTRTKGPVLPP